MLLSFIFFIIILTFSFFLQDLTKTIEYITKNIDYLAMAERNIIEERQKSIASYILRNGKATLSELSSVFNTNETTIRRDLISLEKSNLILRTHGGAIKNDEKNSVWQVSSIHKRLDRNREIKQKIAEFTSTLIKDNESIILDGGSTTQILSEYLVNKNNILTITNSPLIGEIMTESKGGSVILLGGEMQKETISTSGTETENHLRTYSVDKCILSVTGADVDDGCYAAIPSEASLKRLMLTRAREKILILDSSKFLRKALCYSFSFKDVDIVITDSGTKKEIIDKLKEMGLTLFVV